MTKYDSDVLIYLVDNNKDKDDDKRCGDQINCGAINCGRCPFHVTPEKHKNTMGDVRRLDPRNGDTEVQVGDSQPEYNGGSSDYYQVTIKATTTVGRPEYIAECNDIIEALGMNFAEGNAFKALWRRAAQRTLGKRKAGAKDDGLYDAQKVEFFGARLVAQSKGLSDETE